MWCLHNSLESALSSECPIKSNTALGMTGAVTFVIVLATMVTYLIQTYVLNKLGIAFMQTITFILVIAALVQMVEIILKKVSKSLYQALGIFPALHHYQLRRSWSGNTCNKERL